MSFGFFFFLQKTKCILTNIPQKKNYSMIVKPTACCVQFSYSCRKDTANRGLFTTPAHGCANFCRSKPPKFATAASCLCVLAIQINTFRRGNHRCREEWPNAALLVIATRRRLPTPTAIVLSMVVCTLTWTSMTLANLVPLVAVSIRCHAHCTTYHRRCIMRAHRAILATINRQQQHQQQRQQQRQQQKQQQQCRILLVSLVVAVALSKRQSGRDAAAQAVPNNLNWPASCWQSKSREGDRKAQCCVSIEHEVFILFFFFLVFCSCQKFNTDRKYPCARHTRGERV